MSLESKLDVTTSCLPSPLKSPEATKNGLVPTAAAIIDGLAGTAKLADLPGPSSSAAATEVKPSSAATRMLFLNRSCITRPRDLLFTMHTPFLAREIRFGLYE